MYSIVDSFFLKNHLLIFDLFDYYITTLLHFVGFGAPYISAFTLSDISADDDLQCFLNLFTELFSVPTLTVSPAEVFQKEYMTLTCKSERYASERLRREELTYTLDPPDNPLIRRNPGVFIGKALTHDFNYTCVAQAKGITKRSETLTIRPKGKLILLHRFRVVSSPFQSCTS